MTTRREFLRTNVAVGTLLALDTSTPAIEPFRRRGPRMRLSIAAYSYRKYLDLTIKPKPPMSLDDFIDVAASLDLDAVELTAYYFAQTAPEYLAHLKGKCTRLGLDISGTAVGNNFCTRDPVKLVAQIEHVKTWVNHASRLGAKTVRIFAGSVDECDTEDQARARCVDGIREVCDYAGRYGIYLALENHGGITQTAEQLMRIVRAVEHPWFGVNLDTGNFRSPDPYEDIAKVAPYAVTVQLKTELQPAGRNKEEADLKRLIAILRSARYRGYVALEYEAAEDPISAIPRHVEALRKLLA